MIGQILDQLILQEIVYDILDAVGEPLFNQHDIGLPCRPWEVCPKGIAVTYKFQENRLSLSRVSLGVDWDAYPRYLRARDPISGTYVKLPKIDDRSATISDNVATWDRLRQPVYFTGTMVVGVGNMPDDFSLGDLRLGSTEFNPCYELTFEEGLLLHKQPCTSGRARRLRNTEDQLMHAVRDETRGDGLMGSLLRHVLPEKWTEGCKCPLAAFARGPISGFPLDEVLAYTIDHRACEDSLSHPLAHLHQILADARKQPNSDTGRTKYERILHNHISKCKCLHDLERAIAPSRDWDISIAGACPYRKGQQTCPRLCGERMHLEHLRRIGSPVRGENLVRFDLGFVPLDCDLARESRNCRIPW